MARPTSNLQDPSILSATLEGLELQRKRLDDQIAMVRSLLGGRKSSASVSVSTSEDAPDRRKRVLSEEARLRIAAAQKKRWAAFRKVKKTD